MFHYLDSHIPSLKAFKWLKMLRLAGVFHPVTPVLASFIGFLFMSGSDFEVLLITYRNPKRWSSLYTSLTSLNLISHLRRYTLRIQGSCLCPELKRSQLAVGLLFPPIVFLWFNLPADIRQSASTETVTLKTQTSSLWLNFKGP